MGIIYKDKKMKKSLLGFIIAIAFLAGCTDEKKEPQANSEEALQNDTGITEIEKTSKERLIEQLKESTSKVANKISEESKEIALVGNEVIKDISEDVIVKTEEMKEEVIKVTQDTKEEMANVVQNTQEKIEQSIEEIVATKTDTTNESNAKKLNLKCAGCHGQEGEKRALRKSQVIKGWTKEEVVTTLNGYKEGTYGGPLKGVMKSQVLNLSNEDINALGEYIASF